MNKEIENKLLETNSLNEFREIISKNGITTTKELSETVLAHYNKLGSMQTAEKHTDPRMK